jgi:hypothetical protein
MKEADQLEDLQSQATLRALFEVMDIDQLWLSLSDNALGSLIRYAAKQLSKFESTYVRVHSV